MTFLISFFLFACGDKASDTNTEEADEYDSAESNAEGENNVQVDCPRFTEEDCIASEFCTPIMAAPISYNETDVCWEIEEKQFVECMSVENSCGEMILHARAPSSSECMRFDTSCIPIQWKICNFQ